MDLLSPAASAQPSAECDSEPESCTVPPETPSSTKTPNGSASSAPGANEPPLGASASGPKAEAGDNPTAEGKKADQQEGVPAQSELGGDAVELVQQTQGEGPGQEEAAVPEFAASTSAMAANLLEQMHQPPTAPTLNPPMPTQAVPSTQLEDPGVMFSSTAPPLPPALAAMGNGGDSGDTSAGPTVGEVPATVTKKQEEDDAVATLKVKLRITETRCKKLEQDLRKEKKQKDDLTQEVGQLRAVVRELMAEKRQANRQGQAVATGWAQEDNGPQSPQNQHGRRRRPEDDYPPASRYNHLQHRPQHHQHRRSSNEGMNQNQYYPQHHSQQFRGDRGGDMGHGGRQQQQHYQQQRQGYNQRNSQQGWNEAPAQRTQHVEVEVSEPPPPPTSGQSREDIAALLRQAMMSQDVAKLHHAIQCAEENGFDFEAQSGRRALARIQR
mmetsp:Transcript_2901/g.3785  ORF Transcript_2901/g.3785 Transcript_2901/m.3785 type:complete len:440 (-) Transcript_2901:129-1448(-)